ncbi:hypothetical protein ABZY91_09630, partial [Kitasatospora sp. NPDC002965]
MRTPVVRVASSSSAPVPAPVRASVPALGPDAVPEPVAEPVPEPDPEPVTGAARGADVLVPVRAGAVRPEQGEHGALRHGQV